MATPPWPNHPTTAAELLDVPARGTAAAHRHHHGRQRPLGAAARAAADRRAPPRRGQRPPHRPRSVPGSDIEQLTLYCLSSENWKRPQHELDFLMHLLEQYMIEERTTIMEQNIRVQRDRPPRRAFPTAVLREMDKTIDMSADEHGHAAVPGDQLRQPGGTGRRRARDRRRGRSAASSTRTTIDEETIADAPLHGRHARPRPADPHGRRDAGQQLPAVADQLRRDLGDRALLARFRESDLHQAIRDFAARDRRFGGLNE